MIYTLEKHGYPILELDGKVYFVDFFDELKEHPTVGFDDNAHNIIPYDGAFPNDYVILQKFLCASIIKKVLDETNIS